MRQRGARNGEAGETGRPRQDTGRVARLTGLAVLAVVASVAAACSSNSGSDRASQTASDNGILVTAFHADMGDPDPDIFYAVEGLQVTLSCYQGLLQYQPTTTNVNTAPIVGLLASSWQVSPDGLTYTFHLRPGLTFADGTKVTASDVEWSFKRMAKINQGASYMVAGITGYQTPDASTIVFKLAKPVSAFLSYMASPYGPKILNEALLLKHQVKSDLGQQWLQTHSAGTGPYQISQWVTGDHYTLTRNSNYWGGKPGLAQIRINIVPDVSSEMLQLSGGSLDLSHDISPETYAQYASNSQFTEIKFADYYLEKLNLNPHKPPFNDIAVRKALEGAIDKATLVQQVWGPLATPSVQLIPAGMLPAGLGSDTWPSDPGALKAIAATLPASSKKVTIAYQQGASQDERMANSVATILINAGFNATTQAVPISATFNYRTSAEANLPNAELELDSPDSGSPETFAGIYYRSTGALDFFHAGDPNADALMDQGLAATSTSQANGYYGQALDLLHSEANFLSLADVDGVMIAKKCLTGYTMMAAAPYYLNLTNAHLSC